MSRPLSPFIRHMGEARYRCRLLSGALERVGEAAMAATTPGDDGAALAAAIDAAREHLALLERQAERWRAESSSEPAQPTRGAGLRAEIASF